MIVHITAFQYDYDNIACYSNSSSDVHMRWKSRIKRYSPEFSGEITYISILVLIAQIKMGYCKPWWISSEKGTKWAKLLLENSSEFFLSQVLDIFLNQNCLFHIFQQCNLVMLPQSTTTVFQ